MNKKLTALANRMELFGVLLLLFSALRADGGLQFWLAPALCGTALGIFGLSLSWLCGSSGLAFRRRLSRTKPAAPRPDAPPTVIPFPKAG